MVLAQWLWFWRWRFTPIRDRAWAGKGVSQEVREALTTNASTDAQAAAFRPAAIELRRVPNLRLDGVTPFNGDKGAWKRWAFVAKPALAM